MTSSRIRRAKFFRLAPGREVRLRYGVLHHLPRGDQGRARARSSRCGARYDPATRGGNAPGRAQGEGNAALGVRGPRARGGGSPVRSALLEPRTGRRWSRGSGLPRRSEPAVADHADRLLRSSRAWRTRSWSSRTSSSGSATSALDPDARPGTAGLQPHRDLAGHLGEDPVRRVTCRQQELRP